MNKEDLEFNDKIGINRTIAWFYIYDNVSTRVYDVVNLRIGRDNNFTHYDIVAIAVLESQLNEIDMGKEYEQT